jgi:hypothetical protein
MHVTLPERRSDRAWLVFGVLLACVVATFADGVRIRRYQAAVDRRNADVAGALGLTDLCIYGNMPHLRHLSRFDEASRPKDHPGSFDYSRGGMITAPPRTAGHAR